MWLRVSAYLSRVRKLDSMLVDDAAKIHEKALSEVSPIPGGNRRSMYLCQQGLHEPHSQ